jgi:hypothetical protein
VSQEPLKPCPWCGRAPSRSGYSDIFWCGNTDCPNKSEFSEKEWNHRASPVGQEIEAAIRAEARKGRR